MTFRDEQPSCPCCADRALTPQVDHESRLRCDGCRGLFVPTAEVEDMIRDLVHEPWSLDDHLEPITGGGDRICPRCTAQMETRGLLRIPIDRCPAHGVWFDGKELAMVIEAASGVDPFLIQDGPQYAERSRGAKLLMWLRGSRHHGPLAPRRPPEE